MALPAEKIWLTGWGEEAEDTFSCGWRTLAGDRGTGDLWKYYAIEKFLAEEAVSKIIWFDDELEAWNDKMPSFPIPTMKISPLLSKGLSTHHLLLARKFLLET